MSEASAVAVGIREKISRSDVEMYKQRVLEESVLVSPQEAARILDCGDRKVYDLVRSGRLSGYTENPKRKGLRLLASELRDYVKSMKVDRDEWRL